MLCRDMMHRPVESCRADETIVSAARKMRDRNIGFLPICDRTGRAIGVLTDRDIALRVCAEGHPGSTPVSDAMTRELISCLPGDDLDRAEGLMRDHRKSRVLVLDDEGRPAGIISLADLARRDVHGAARTLHDVAAREVLDPYGNGVHPTD